jgi:hypothetical protein
MILYLNYKPDVRLCEENLAWLGLQVSYVIADRGTLHSFKKSHVKY